MIFRIVQKDKYEEMCNRLKNCIVNVEELLKDIELISTEELSCLVAVLSVKLNEKIIENKEKNEE